MNQESMVLRAAEGYGELGMFDEALAEIATLSPVAQKRVDVLKLRLALNMQSRRWLSALEDSLQLCRAEPLTAQPFIHTAFCLHELGRTAEAKATLLQGPSALLREPTYFYNLACYDAILGNIESAQAYLRSSFQMDKKFRLLAKTDPDLQAIRELL